MPGSNDPGPSTARKPSVSTRFVSIGCAGSFRGRSTPARDPRSSVIRSWRRRRSLRCGGGVSSRSRGAQAAMSASPDKLEPQGQSRPGSQPESTVFRHVRYENLVAGVSGGVLSNLVLHPLDLVKIRFAVSDGLEVRPKYKGIVHCLTSIWKMDGLRGLYQGVTPNVWGAGLSWGLYFFFYNAIKSYKTEGRNERLQATEYLTSAAQAGAMTLCITNPLWVTKTRLMLQYDHSPAERRYHGTVDAVVKIYKSEGVRGLYKGFVPGLLGTSHGALQFMMYELLKVKYNKYINRLPDAQLSTMEYVSTAALSKIFAVSATYPYQVVRARLQDQHIYYDGVFHVIKRTWSKEGIHGFYKGIVPNLITVTPACCITFVVYENVSQFLFDLGERRR